MTQTPPPANQPVDAEARAQALDISQSFAVSAPAGSGKTGLLTQRLLKLLSACQQPEEVLAITFTRKAAGEMRERLLHALLDARDNPEPDNPHGRVTWQLARDLLAHDEKQQWHLLQSPQRLRIQTIDGLCRNIASQLPIDSGLGAPGEPLEQPAIAYEMAIANLLKKLEQEQLDEDLGRLLLHLDNNLPEVSGLLQTLLEKREQWLEPLLSVHNEEAEDYFTFVIHELIREQLETFGKSLGSFAGELVQLAGYAGSNLQKEKPEHIVSALAGIAALPPCSDEGLPQWLALAELLVTGTGTFRKSISKTIGFPPADKKSPDPERAKAAKDAMTALLADISENTELLQIVTEVRTLPSGMDDNQWQILRALARVLPLLVAELKLVFQQLGSTDFTEVAQAALVALGESDSPTDVALKLDVQLRHILVDEFQDTSQLQLELLQKLTAGWEPDDGRSLFIVGDGMQSCYGFRNANVGIFLDARNEGIGELPLSPLNLQVNFRSSNAVVDWVNHTFRQAFPRKDNISRGAVRYLDSVAFKPEIWGAPPVSFYGCIDDAERLQEAEKAVDIIQSLQATAPDDSIAILVRNKKHLQQILPALTRAGIPYQAQDLSPLASKMVVLDLLSLTRALQDPSDRISWLAVLRAPWCGLTLPDLYAVANHNGAELGARDPRVPPVLNSLGELDQITGLSESGRNRLQLCADLLLNSWRERGRKPLRVWVEGLWLALGGPATVADKKELSNAADFFQLLEKYDQGGSIADWPAFEQALEKLFARPAQEAKVQVMTIHKSKGLEFDHVLIPGLDKTGGAGGSDQLLRWCTWLNSEVETRFLLAPKSPRSGKDPLYAYVKHDNSERERLEGTRLLYVGCTRAIHSLHLLASVKSSDKKNEDYKAPASASLLASIWPALVENPDNGWCHWIETDALAETSERADYSYLLRLPEHWQRPAHPRQDYLARYRVDVLEQKEDDEPNLPELGQVQQRWFRHAGTVAHESLATLAESPHRLAAPPAQLIEEMRPLWQLRLSQAGLNGSNLEYALEKVEQALLRTLNCSTGRWLLDAGHQQAAAELEMHSGGQQLRRNIVDRTFVDAEGTRWIVDYKTAEPAAGEPEEAFVESQLEQYRKQMDNYRRLFYQRGEKNIRCALYFPLLQRLAELPPE
ncbi:UvrD-helicase domain-containing protein [Microbulbifer bruguierae]|uniref:DNA 3'-5' helicase n=1 Tax=Microbulbifer bruguierae TaxID=3029061 RepID=A0ABY8NDI4_9GAMM|nr:UvrD-helicase domain-containing protein [Microbulbifer bruguierae]WGL16980.1 UvrD-helicase domain-containing protein [Microbulbifer bruguierae]